LLHKHAKTKNRFNFYAAFGRSPTGRAIRYNALFVPHKPFPLLSLTRLTQFWVSNTRLSECVLGTNKASSDQKGINEALEPVEELSSEKKIKRF
jgi:hypothetical protein